MLTLLAAKPEVGVMYDATTNASGNTAVVQYAEGNNGTKVWLSTGGAVTIESVAKDSVGLRFMVTMAPDASKSANTATGALTVSGTANADDVLGFTP
jgi:hypothetical protein